MKTTRSLSRKIFGSFAAFALLAVAFQAVAESVPQVVTISYVDGPARYMTAGNKSWQELKKGMVLKPGSVIQTAEHSTVDIMLGDHEIMAPTPIKNAGGIAATPLGHSSGTTGANSGGNDSGPKPNIIRIFPSSVLAIDKLISERTGTDEVDETQLDLRAGQILGNVKKLSATSRYEVKIPNGVAGIRGTVYVVSSSGAVVVLSGSVVVSYVGAGGTVYTQTIVAGQSFNPFVNGGQTSTTAGPGTITPISPAIQAALLAQYNALNNNTPTPATTYQPNAPNSTLIHISPN